ncbi:2-isopropylmalate synthase [Paludicola sp. MB14-C6]|uniref:2-isopropylmalate synthase n=1 Tax=Paludihabitans sp. MB14-C6 TaxID=3070656 RepID=UPI0027DAE5C2|nr:2-isopropylmalate synthase [Paludicola sp. MB14-C6]WMJ24451.1 2-isopropylmalate synthase [Paludicola sp. MB14-C6]
MLTYSNSTNMLEQSAYKFSLQDREEPNLYRDLFDYDSVPKISFNHRTVPLNMPDNIWITDTTFRDGQQSTSPFTVEQIVHLYKLLHKLGGPNGIIRQSEFFVYTQKDREALKECMELGYEFPEVTSWIRANENDFTLIKELGLKETGILVSCSDYHIYNKMGLTRAQAMDKYLGVVKSVLAKGIRPRCHFEDITRADFYGFVVPLAEALNNLGIEAGIPIKIRACDTMGYGISYPGAALPRSVPGIIYGLNHYAGIPSELLEWHGHNDFYKVVTNAATAWLYGSSSVNCSMLGIGERTGNCPLEAMVIEYAQLRGTTDGMDLSAITEIADYFEKAIGYEIPPRTPFVGRNFNVTRAGIHADGLLKNEEIYNIFNTEKLLNRPATVAVDSHSGLAGIAHWINGFFRLNGSGEEIDKRSDIVLAIKKLVDLEYEQGRNTTMGDAELEVMLQKVNFDEYERLAHIHLHKK